MKDFSLEAKIKEIILEFKSKPFEEVISIYKDKITDIEYNKTSIDGRTSNFEFRYEDGGYFYIFLDREKKYATQIAYECRGPAYNYYALKFVNVFLIKNNTAIVSCNPKTFKYISEENFEIKISTAINLMTVSFNDIDMKKYAKCSDVPENEEYIEFNDTLKNNTSIENDTTIKNNDKCKIIIEKNGKLVCELKI